MTSSYQQAEEQAPDDLHGDLADFVRDLRINTPPTWVEEFRILRYLIERGGDQIARLRSNEIVRLLDVWHQRFRASLSPETPLEGVICGFSAVEDIVYLLDQDEINAFITWVARSATPATGPQGGGTDITTRRDLLRSLARAFRLSGLKFVVDNSVLRIDLAAYITEREAVRPDRVKRVLGGAATVINDILAQLGLRRARVCTMYYPNQLARLFAPTAMRLEVLDGQPQALSARAGYSHHPQRSSFVFQYEAGVQIGKFQASSTDRVIFLIPRHIRANKHWSKALLTQPEQNPVPLISQQGVDEWPFLPGFVTWEQRNTNLIISFADQQMLDRIAQEHYYVMLSGLGLRNFPDRQPQIQAGFTQQLKTLAEKGCKLHLELSGSVDRQQDQIDMFAKQVIDCQIRSVGINHEELTEFGQLADLPPPTLDPNRSSFFHRYQRAAQLGERLGLNRIYIHGNDVDLILRKGASPCDMQQEIRASLFAKGVVVLAILKRSAPDIWRSYASKLAPVLLEYGFEALIRLASDLADHIISARPPQPDVSPAWVEHERDQIFRDLIATGYYVTRDPQQYSLAVVPVMWPTPPSDIQIITSSAGDICSGVSLVFSGY